MKKNQEVLKIPALSQYGKDRIHKYQKVKKDGKK